MTLDIIVPAAALVLALREPLWWSGVPPCSEPWDVPTLCLLSVWQGHLMVPREREDAVVFAGGRGKEYQEEGPGSAQVICFSLAVRNRPVASPWFFHVQPELLLSGDGTLRTFSGVGGQ